MACAPSQLACLQAGSGTLYAHMFLVTASIRFYYGTCTLLIIGLSYNPLLHTYVYRSVFVTLIYCVVINYNLTAYADQYMECACELMTHYLHIAYIA